MLLNRLNRSNRLHYGFEKFIYFWFQQKKIACIIEIIEIQLCHFFLSCTLCHFFLCHFFLCHFFLVPFFPVPFFPVPFFPVPFFPTLVTRRGYGHLVKGRGLSEITTPTPPHTHTHIHIYHMHTPVSLSPDIHTFTHPITYRSVRSDTHEASE